MTEGERERGGRESEREWERERGQKEFVDSNSSLSFCFSL
jgi:hypothetical protein